LLPFFEFATQIFNLGETDPVLVFLLGYSF